MKGKLDSICSGFNKDYIDLSLEVISFCLNSILSIYDLSNSY